MTADGRRSRDDVLFLVGVALWIAVMLATWPRALSFGDEVGYVGRAKLVLEHHLHYVPRSPGVWVATPHGVGGKYPLFQSLLLAALATLAPRAMFALGVGAAVWLAVLARDVLRSWGKSPAWALIVLAHPTVIILARTTMADLPQATAAFAAWWALRRGRRLATVAWLAVLVALKPTGAVLALAVVAGEALSSRAALVARDPATWRRLAWGVAGGFAGLAVLVTCNYATNGHAWFDYTHAAPGAPPFAARYVPTTVPAHAVTLLLVPPLLIMGALSYWRRRELAPLVTTAVFLGMMCAYYFVDEGPNRVETLVLAPRVILPVVTFLLVGYAAWLDDLVARVVGARGAGEQRALPVGVAGALVALCVLVAGAVSWRHAKHDAAMGQVRAVASAVADAHGERTLGLTLNACKAGLLHDGPTTIFDPKSNRTAVVFCSEVSASHRGFARAASCAFPGYHAVASRDGFFALARDDAGGDAR